MDSRRLAVARRGLHALQTGLGDDVDHAGDRVRAVDGRRAVLEHLDALDHGDRDHVQVDGAVGAGTAVDDAAAVEQHQGAVDAQTAQIDLGRAVAVASPVGAGLVAGGACRGRKALQEGFGGDGAGALDGLGVDHGDRADAGDLGLLQVDAAASDLHLVQ